MTIDTTIVYAGIFERMSSTSNPMSDPEKIAMINCLKLLFGEETHNKAIVYSKFFLEYRYLHPVLEVFKELCTALEIEGEERKTSCCLSDNPEQGEIDSLRSNVDEILGIRIHHLEKFLALVKESRTVLASSY